MNTLSLQVRTGDDILNLFTHFSDIDDGLRSDQIQHLQIHNDEPSVWKIERGLRVLSADPG